MLAFAIGLSMILGLGFWSATIASAMRPRTISMFLFYSYLICIFTVNFIAETVGYSDFSRATYFKILLPLGVGGAFYWFYFKREDAKESAISFVRSLKDLDKSAAFLLVLWSMIVLYVGAYIFLTAPGHSPDAKIYHLPGPIMWVFKQSIEPLLHLDLRINYLPHATEILYGFYYIITGSWIGVESVNLIIGGIIWPLSLYLLLTSISINRSWALLISLAGATSSVNFWQMYSAHVDVHMAALMTGSIALLFQKKIGSFEIAAAGLAAGLAIAVKTMALLWLLPIGAVLLMQAWKHKYDIPRTCLLVFIFFSVVLLTGGAVYLQNWMQFGNPVYPFPLDLKLVSFPGAEFPSTWGSVSRLITKGADWIDAVCKTCLWGFGLLFGCFEYIEQETPKGDLGFSIEIMLYSALLILGLQLTNKIEKAEINQLQKRNQYKKALKFLVNGCFLVGLSALFTLAFWPWGRESSADQFLNIYNGIIYIIAYTFLVLLAKELLADTYTPIKDAKENFFNAGLSILSIIIFFFLVIKFYAPLTFLARFAFMIVIIPIILITMGLYFLGKSTRQTLKKGIILIFIVSMLNSLVFKSPQVTSSSNIPIFRMYRQLKMGNEFAYWRGDKKDIWENIISPDDVLLVIKDKNGHNIKYHMPGFRRVVYMAHPYGPYRMDADTDSMPLQIKQQLENSYSTLPKKKLNGNYGVGIGYLEYLCNKVGVTKIYAEKPVPRKLLPDTWHLLRKTSWGAFYEVNATEE